MTTITTNRPTPVLAEDLKDRIDDVLQLYEHRGLYRAWGLDKLREQGSAVLFHGKPGTGKTITAYYIAKRLHLRIVEISMADFGSQTPGQLARNIKKIFNGEKILAKESGKQLPIIFL